MLFRSLWWQFGRFAKAVAGLDPAGEGFRPAAVTTNGSLRVHALEGKRTLLLWCRDGRADWRGELERGEAAPPVDGATPDLSPLLRGRGAARVTVYDPWRDVSESAAVAGGRVALPSFRRSIVVRVALAPGP